MLGRASRRTCAGPGGLWFGFSQRARVIAYNKAKVKPDEIQTLRGLSVEPKWKGRICMRSATSIYSLSLMGALIDHLGEQKAEAWAVMPRPTWRRIPRVATAISSRRWRPGNATSRSRTSTTTPALVRSDKADEREAAGRIGIVMPNQKTLGNARQHLRRRGARGT